MSLSPSGEYLFFVVTVREDQCSSGLEALFEQVRDGLPCGWSAGSFGGPEHFLRTLSDEQCLVIGSTSTPDHLAVVVSRKGAVRPSIKGRLGSRNHVVVGHTALRSAIRSPEGSGAI